MKANDLINIHQKPLAVICCASVLLIATFSHADCLGCDLARISGQEQPCCCNTPDRAEDHSPCCQSIPQYLAGTGEDGQLDPGRDQCACIDAPLGSESSQYTSSVPSKPGGNAHLPLEAPPCPPVDPLVRIGKIVIADTMSPPAATGILGTVVLQL